MYEIYKRIRDAKGYKDADISKNCGIAQSSLSEWKSGKTTPKIDKLKAIANFLDVSLNELTGQKEEAEEDYYIDKDTRDLAEFLHKNPAYQVLFDASRKVKPDDIKKALKAIGLFIEE